MNTSKIMLFKRAYSNIKISSINKSFSSKFLKFSIHLVDSSFFECLSTIRMSSFHVSTYTHLERKKRYFLCDGLRYNKEAPNHNNKTKYKFGNCYAIGLSQKGKIVFLSNHKENAENMSPALSLNIVVNHMFSQWLLSETTIRPRGHKLLQG